MADKLIEIVQRAKAHKGAALAALVLQILSRVDGQGRGFYLCDWLMGLMVRWSAK